MKSPRQIHVASVCRPACAVRTLFDETRAHATREGKTPVLTLAEKGARGFLIVVDPADLPQILAEYKAARSAEESH